MPSVEGLTVDARYVPASSVAGDLYDFLQMDGRRVRGGEIRELGATNPLLGRFRNAKYTSATLELRRGDRILAYTDGVVEARNGRGESFGEERLHALLLRDAALAEIVTAVENWRRRGSDADDLTLVTVEIP